MFCVDFVESCWRQTVTIGIWTAPCGVVCRVVLCVVCCVVLVPWFPHLLSVPPPPITPSKGYARYQETSLPFMPLPSLHYPHPPITLPPLPSQLPSPLPSPLPHRNSAQSIVCYALFAFTCALFPLQFAPYLMPYCRAYLLPICPPFCPSLTVSCRV